jgi:pyrroline-5-carboxylate reductase
LGSDNMKNEKPKIVVIGVGNMGAAIVRGLIDASVTAPENVIIFDPDREKMDRLNSELGVTVSDSLEAALEHNIRVVLVAVKPQMIGGVLDSLSHFIKQDSLVISIAAGISTVQLLDRLGKDKRVIRAMPNAAAMVGQSATALCRGGMADDGDLEMAIELFNAVGSTVCVDEKWLNAVTALSGGGPGYLFVVMEAMSDAGVLLGLPRNVARKLTVQTFSGAATMAAQAKSFSDLKDMITSPGGTTISGLKIMERAGTRGVFMETIAAAARRADELSRQ